MPNLQYTLGPFLPFTKIASADVNTYFSDIKTLLNTTKLDSTNVQQYGLTRDRLAQTSINQVLINDGSGTMSSEAQLATSRGGLGFAPTINAGNAGLAVTVNNSGNALTLASPIVGNLTEQLAGTVPSLVAGETIAANAAVCLDLAKDSSNNNIYLVFNCNSSLGNRKNNFIGFASSGASVTQGTWTWVASANFVTSNVITFSINGRAYSVNFTSSNAATLTAIAAVMAADPDIAGAVSDGVHTITITGSGSKFINVTGSLVTGGASQATITYTNTLVPVGGSVIINSFGPMAGFTSLTATGLYYLDASNGAITNNPLDSVPVSVGQALSSTVLFVNNGTLNTTFSVPGIFVRTHGNSTSETASGAVKDAEHYNFSSWSAGTSGTTNAYAVYAGEAQYSNYHHVLEGLDTSSSINAYFAKYNKASWSSLTARGTNKYAGASTGVFNGIYYAGKGEAGGGGTTGNLDAWNGSTWTTAVATLGTAGSGMNAVSQGNMLHWAGGQASSAGINAHDTFNGASASTATAYPVSDFNGSGMRAGANGIFSGIHANSTSSYSWNGSWSSIITLNYGFTDGSGGGLTATCPGNAYNSNSSLSFMNGGSSSTTVSINKSQQYNGSAWFAATSSSNSRSGAVGSFF